MAKVPSFDELMQPSLDALRELGGKASVNELLQPVFGVPRLVCWLDGRASQLPEGGLIVPHILPRPSAFYTTLRRQDYDLRQQSSQGKIMGEPIRPAKHDQHDHAAGSRYPEGLAILKTYDRRYKFSVSGLADIIRVAEEIGWRQVDEMFEAWFYREQVPDIPELSLSMGN